MHAAQVLDELMVEADCERVVYLGDGAGDFCPCTKLRPCDYAVARECYPTGVHHAYLIPCTAGLRLCLISTCSSTLLPILQSESSTPRQSALVGVEMYSPERSCTFPPAAPNFQDLDNITNAHACRSYLWPRK